MQLAADVLTRQMSGATPPGHVTTSSLEKSLLYPVFVLIALKSEKKKNQFISEQLLHTLSVKATKVSCVRSLKKSTKF